MTCPNVYLAYSDGRMSDARLDRGCQELGNSALGEVAMVIATSVQEQEKSCGRKCAKGRRSALRLPLNGGIFQADNLLDPSPLPSAAIHSAKILENLQLFGN